MPRIIRLQTSSPETVAQIHVKMIINLTTILLEVKFVNRDTINEFI